jgi:hypothetical protein
LGYKAGTSSVQLLVVGFQNRHPADQLFSPNMSTSGIANIDPKTQGGEVDKLYNPT